MIAEPRPIEYTSEPVRPRVLLVEACRHEAELLCQHLAVHFDVTLATSVEQALRFSGESAFDAALVDASVARFGNGNGLEGLTRAGMVSVIFLKQADDGEPEEPLTLGAAHHYLVKGEFSRRQLRRSVSSVIRDSETWVQYQTFLESTPDAILLLDADGVIRFANRAAVEALSTEEQPLVGTVFGVPLGDGATEITVRDGRTMEMRVARVPWRRRLGYLTILRDVTERVEMVKALADANEKLQLISLVDPLTGVLNRRGTEDALARICASSRRQAERAVGLLIDCDNFKAINSHAGYTVGDKTLQLIAQTIKSRIRVGTDVVGRIGGDEFLVLLANTRLAEGMLIAEQIRDAVGRTPLPLSGEELPNTLSVSVGVGSIEPGMNSLREVISLTESAVLASKEGGKNCVTAGTDGNADDRFRDLIAAPDSIRVAAQPIVQLIDDAEAGCELLFRGPSQSLLESPGMFFAAARMNSSLTVADRVCLQRCADVADRMNRPHKVHINIYPSTLLDTPTTELLELLNENQDIVLELSEQEFVGDASQLVNPVNRLRSRGLRLALDDVGFGRSSLETILMLAPEIIKLDRCIVSGVATDGGRRQILTRLVRVLEGLDSQLVAEGVETRADAKVLIDLGIRFAQGFLWGQPQLVESGVLMTTAS